MVPSKGEAKNVERISHRKEPIQVTESDENETVAFDAKDTNGHADGQTVSNGTNNTHGTNPNESQNKQNDETKK